MPCNKTKRKVIKHLKGDAKTWDKLSIEAKKEAKSDRKLIRKLNKVV